MDLFRRALSRIGVDKNNHLQSMEEGLSGILTDRGADEAAEGELTSTVPPREGIRPTTPMNSSERPHLEHHTPTKVRVVGAPSPLAAREKNRKRRQNQLSDLQIISNVNHMADIEEIRQQAAIHLVKVEEAAQAKYDSAMNDVRRDVAAQIAQTETAALKKYTEAVENVRREAADKVAQSEEKATQAINQAEAAASSASDMYNQVQALMKQVLGTNTRAEVAEKAAGNAALRAERAEEEVKQMKGRLEMTKRDMGSMGSRLFSLRWPIQEEEVQTWTMGETDEHDQLMDVLEPPRADDVLTGHAMQATQNAHTTVGQKSMPPTIDPVEPSDTEMFDSGHVIYAAGDSGHSQKRDGGPSQTKGAESTVRSSGENEKAAIKGKGQLIVDPLEIAEDQDERMDDSPLKNSSYGDRGSRGLASSSKPRRSTVQSNRAKESKRTATPALVHSRATDVKADQEHGAPLPQKFSRPKSGGGKRVKICMPRRITPNESLPSDDDSGSEPESQGGISSEDQMKKMATMYRYQPRKKNFYRKSHQRGYDPRYAEVKTAVRVEMNEFLGISKNDEIVNIDLATHEEVNRYENGDQDEPPLQPMRPYLEGKLLVEWNNTLCRLFVEHLADKKGWELTDSVRDVLETVFENRLSTLRKVLRRLENKTQEEIDNMKRVSGKQQRTSSRRDKMWLDRRQICVENVTGRDGRTDPGWKATLYMVETLTMAGMSSDESEIDNEGRPYYIVKRRAWRSTAVGARLQFIDSQMNRTGATGGIRPGNAPRKRVRIQGAPVSNRDPPTSCPKNFYSREFVANLSNRAYSGLKMKAEKELGEVS